MINPLFGPRNAAVFSLSKAERLDKEIVEWLLKISKSPCNALDFTQDYQANTIFCQIKGRHLVINRRDEKLTFYYNQKGLLDRSDGPAYESSTCCHFYQEGLLHRIDGPAFVFSPKSSKKVEEWFFQGRPHRIDAPAITGSKNYWYIDGKRYTCDFLAKRAIGKFTQGRRNDSGVTEYRVRDYLNAHQ